MDLKTSSSMGKGDGGAVNSTELQKIEFSCPESTQHSYVV